MQSQETNRSDNQIHIVAINGKQAGFVAERSEEYDCYSMKKDPIERGSLYAKILTEYVKGLLVPFYSISHSGNYCICCYGNVPCGIDIEKKRILPSYMLLEGFAKESERFLRQWVEVESYAKLKQIPLNQFGRYDEIKFEGVKFFHIEIEGYELCVCVKETEMVSKYINYLTDHPKNLKLS